MLLLPPSVRILLAAHPVDMRNSIDGLANVVRSQWKENLFAGSLFVFISKRGDRVKILSWDSGGFVILYKRLEQGRFKLPVFHDDALGAQLDTTQLTMLLDGIDLSHVRRPRKWAPPPPTEGDRQIPRDLISSDKWRPARTARMNALGKRKQKSFAPKTKRSARRSRS